MARFVIKNINFNAQVSPSRYSSKYSISEDQAYTMLFDEQQKLEAKGWAIVREISTVLCEGIQMSTIGNDGIEYHCQLLVRL